MIERLIIPCKTVTQKQTKILASTSGFKPQASGTKLFQPPFFFSIFVSFYISFFLSFFLSHLESLLSIEVVIAVVVNIPNELGDWSATISLTSKSERQ